MMLRILFTLLLFFGTNANNYAQPHTDASVNTIPEAYSGSVDELSGYIKQHFTTDSARIRAIYNWVTANISYDVPRFQSMKKSPHSPGPTVAAVLAKRTGVCQDYSDLFVALCQGAGIDAINIAGYTKMNGEVATLSHSWVAAFLDGSWHLFDPTWGAGYVKNDVFVKRFNNEFFKVPPATFIARHMPFDPLYQLLSNPLTNHEFIDGKPASGKTMFNYRDSIQQHRQLSRPLQASAELRRLEAGGLPHSLLQERRMYLKNVIQSAASKNSFEEGLTNYRAAINLHKIFVGHQNKQFSTITDPELQHTIDSIEFYIKKSRELVSGAVAKTEAQWGSKTRQIASIDKLWVDFIRQKDFTLKYLATDKDKRTQLFMR